MSEGNMDMKKAGSKKARKREDQRKRSAEIDEESGVVRIEKVVMHREMYDKEFKGKSMKGAFFKRDDLRWWDSKSASTFANTEKKIRRMLSLRKEETLGENMVFVVFKRGRTVERVFHVTQAARELSKKLYLEVIGTGPVGE
jgi:hypothetical protein